MKPIGEVIAKQNSFDTAVVAYSSYDHKKLPNCSYGWLYFDTEMWLYDSLILQGCVSLAEIDTIRIIDTFFNTQYLSSMS